MIGKEQLRAKLATPKGKLTAALAALALCWIFIIFYIFGDAISAFGDPQSLGRARQELERQRAEYERVAVRYGEAQTQKKRYREILASAWHASGEEQVKTTLHNSITATASKLEFKLSRIGSVNTGRLNSKLYYADVDISADGKLDEIVNLVAALEEIAPKPMWKQLVLRPDNRPRPQSGAGADSLNLANQMMNVERTRVTMSGTLRVICTDEAPKAETERAPRK